MRYPGCQDSGPVQRAGLAPTLAASFHNLLAAGKTGYSHSAFINAVSQLRHLLTTRLTTWFNLEAKRLQAHQSECLQLDSSNISIKTVAAEVDYRDPLYFSRLFTKTLGLSPGTCRRSVKK
ncbi:MAG: AraC family transcriptional regulator [Parahaliea sp.]